MTGRRFLDLTVLIVTLGVACKDEIIIETLNEKNLNSGQTEQKEKEIGAKVFFCNKTLKIVSLNLAFQSSGLASSRENSGVKIFLKAPIDSDWTVNLNTAIDSVKKESYGDQKHEQENILKITPDTNNYFTYSTWLSKESKTLEIYLNFLMDSSIVYTIRTLYLRTVVKAEEISSTLMLYQQYDLKGSLNTKFENIFGTSEAEKTKQTKALIKKCNSEERFCIGNQNCKVEKGEETHFNLDKDSITLKGNGELNMILVIKEFTDSDIEKAAINFATSGSTEGDIKTHLAEVKCSEKRIITLSLPDRKRNLRLLSDFKITV